MKTEAIGRVRASPLARRTARELGLDLHTIVGSGPFGRIVKADVLLKRPVEKPIVTSQRRASEPAPHNIPSLGVVSNEAAAAPNGARRATYQAPCIALTIDVAVDALLTLRSELHVALAAQGVTISLTAMFTKALGLALGYVPSCNATFADDAIIRYGRSNIAIGHWAFPDRSAPVISDVSGKSLSVVSRELRDLKDQIRQRQLGPKDGLVGAATLINLGTQRIRHFDPVVTPSQAMVLGIGVAELRPTVVNESLGIAKIMTVTGGFDHRVVNGADGAELLNAFKRLIEAPMSILV
ncbi:pyruvate/2-oxoglutarate dehydrogenase complex dihydrolipoamide acyltransferase (E2) component [Bradyrhizobium sp. S3.12.5]|uniref:2-oxo acid dehydrogenase subunit E2 n=1 Tax=Bradyrhizobium sp. S3.12.5 TaxID=3156386 RepID=UPI003393CA5C